MQDGTHPPSQQHDPLGSSVRFADDQSDHADPAVREALRLAALKSQATKLDIPQQTRGSKWIQAHGGGMMHMSYGRAKSADELQREIEHRHRVRLGIRRAIEVAKDRWIGLRNRLTRWWSKSDAASGV